MKQALANHRLGGVLSKLGIRQLLPSTYSRFMKGLILTACSLVQVTCNVEQRSTSEVTMEITDLATGEPLVGAPVRFVATEESLGTAPDTYIIDNGEDVGPTDANGEFTVLVDVFVAGFPFAPSIPRVIRPLWIVQTQHNDETKVIVIRPLRAATSAPAYLPNYVGAQAEGVSILITRLANE